MYSAALLQWKSIKLVRIFNEVVKYVQFNRNYAVLLEYFRNEQKLYNNFRSGIIIIIVQTQFPDKIVLSRLHWSSLWPSLKWGKVFCLQCLYTIWRRTTTKNPIKINSNKNMWRRQKLGTLRVEEQCWAICIRKASNYIKKLSV